MQKREKSAKNSFLLFKQFGIELNNNKVKTPLNNSHTFFRLRKKIPLSSQIYKSKSASLFEVTKKIKKMTLSNKAYFNYMDKYTKLTQNFSFKTPNLSLYPKKKNQNYLPIFYLEKMSEKNNDDNNNSKTNKNKNIFFRNNNFCNYTNLHSTNLHSTKDNNKNDDNKNSDDNTVKEKPYGFKYKNTRIVYDKNKIKKKSNLFKSSNSSINITNLPNNNFTNKNKANINSHINKKEKIKNKIFEYFYEGDFLERPKSQFSTVDIKSRKDKKPNIIIKDYDTNNCLEDLYDMIKNINKMTDLSINKTMKYDIKNYYQNEDFSFQVDIESICLKFINQEEDKNKENNDLGNKPQAKRLYLPFAYLPIFYLLDYTTFKIFLSEIIYYNRQTNSMEINKNEIGTMLNKYKKFITINVINSAQNKKRKIDNITYNCKEHHYQNIYDWIIYINELNEVNNNNNQQEKIKEVDDTDKKINNIIYEVKIIFPIVKFQAINRRLKIKKYINKNIIIKLIKNNFVKWEEIILCDLFMNKKFRNIMNNSLAPNNRIFSCSYLTKKIFIDRTGNRYNLLSKKKYEFFITNTLKDFSHYLYISPYTVYVLYGRDDEKKIFSTIYLNIKDSINLNKYSQYWGYINTLNKCMKVDYMKQIISFDLSILEKNPQKFFYLEKIDKNKKNKENVKDLENYGILKFKNNYDIEMYLLNCSIAEMQINQNKIDKRFYKVPKSLLNVFLSENMKNNLDLNKYISEYSELILFNDEILNLRKDEIDLKRKAYIIDGTIKLDEEFTSEKHKTIFSSFKNVNKLNSFRINPSSRYSNNPSLNKGLGGIHFFLSASFKRSDSNNQMAGSLGKSLKNLDAFYKKEKIVRKKEKKYTSFHKNRDRKLSKTNVTDFSERNSNKTNSHIIQVKVKEHENTLGKDE